MRFYYVLILIIVGILFIEIGSAQQNTVEGIGRDYNETNRQITLRNESTGDVLARYRLVSNSDFCSNDCKAHIVLQMIGIGNDAFESVSFTDRRERNHNLSNYSIRVTDLLSRQVSLRNIAPGVYDIFIEGGRPLFKSIDWVINTFGVPLIEWAWWYSWQSYNDDFEDNFLNETLWDNSSKECQTLGTTAPVSTLFINETNDTMGDGHVHFKSSSNMGAGDGSFIDLVLWTKQDYKDSRDYTINFTINSTVLAVSNQNNLTLAIINRSTIPSRTGTSCESGGINSDLNQYTFFYNFSTNQSKADYTIQLTGSTGNFSLYHGNGTFITSVIPTEDKWYLAFWHYLVNQNSGIRTQESYLYNYTSISPLQVIVSLISPSNNTLVNNNSISLSAHFNMTQETHNVTNATLYIWNSTGTLIYENVTLFDGDSDNESLNLTNSFNQYGNFTWNYLAYGTNGTHNTSSFSQDNFTFQLNDTVSPSVQIISPPTTVTNNPITINISSSDISNIDYLIYNITRGASTEKEDTRLIDSDLDGYFNDTYSLSGQATYTLNVWVNDTKGNSNSTNITFTYSVSQGGGGGGGGGGTVIIQGDKGWIMQVASGISNLERRMVAGSQREFFIEFENTGESSRTITLTCENQQGDICQYVSFRDNPFELALLKDQIQRVSFTIELPETVERGEYEFNIRARDDLSRDGAITVFLGVGVGGFIVEFVTRLFSSNNAGIPYSLIFFPLFIGGIFIFSQIYKRLPARPIFVLITSLGIGVLTIYLF